MRGIQAVGLILLVLAPVRAEERAVVRVRAFRPDQQLERVLRLFEGSKAPHPAAALAAWRRATGRPEALGKAEQALIALFNPEMVPELRGLDGAEFVLGSTGELVHWFALLPRDDGAFAAVGTALALTDGASEPPLQMAHVDRLGPPGAPLLARTPTGALALANDRTRLAEALERLEHPRAPRPSIPTGWLVQFDPDAEGSPKSLEGRRLAAALKSLACREVEALAALEGEALSLVMTSRFAQASPALVANIDPAWLDWVPAQDTSATATIAFDPRPAAWDRLFELADALEKADPAFSRAAPLRTRFNLVALAAGIRPEIDLWPVLRGVTIATRFGANGRLDALAIVLHTRDAQAAERVAGRVVQPLERTFGRPFDQIAWKESVAVGWGEGWLKACRNAVEAPDRSMGPRLRAPLGTARAQRVGAIWPGRLGQSWSQVLADAPPLIWWGEPADAATATRDVVRWDGLRGVVRQALDRIPMEPAEPPRREIRHGPG